MYKKSGVRGVPKGEEGLIDAENLGRHIKYAAALANYPSGNALARAMTELGCECSYHQMSDWGRGVGVPSITAFFTIVALTAPPGGIKFFAGAWPDLWPLIERGLNGQSGTGEPAPPAEMDLEVDADLPTTLCPNCSKAPIDPSSPYGWCRSCTTAETKTRKAKS